MLVPMKDPGQEKTPTQEKEAWMGHPHTDRKTETYAEDSSTDSTAGEYSDAQVEESPSDHPNYVEVATFRNDGTYSDGRHPDQVSYATDPKEDVQRRDFTINGLLMDPLDGNRVLDFVGGRDDLRAGVI